MEQSQVRTRLLAGAKGFEPLVPPQRGGSFETTLIDVRLLLLREDQARGTEGSNPLPSTGESGANSSQSGSRGRFKESRSLQRRDTREPRLGRCRAGR